MTAHQPYETLRSYDAFEVRRYPEHLLAEVLIEGTFEEAGNRAFRALFGYISGQNHASQKVAMTAPVIQDATSTRIEMTAPVVQEGPDTPADDVGAGSFRVSFVLPEGFTLENAPQPTNPRVRLRSVPPDRGRGPPVPGTLECGELSTASGSASYRPPLGWTHCCRLATLCPVRPSLQAVVHASQ